MQFDYWHIRRYLTLEGMVAGEILPFGGPPLVIDDVISLPEPVWKTAVTTAVARNVPDFFSSWKWKKPLAVDAACDLLASLQSAITEVEKSNTITHPEDLPEDHRLDVETVLSALETLGDLLAFGVQTNRAIETWSE